MDRGSYKPVAIVETTMLVLFGIGIYSMLRRENQILDVWEKEAMLLYPETEAVLARAYEHYGRCLCRNIIQCGIGIAFVSLLAGAGLVFLMDRLSRKERMAERNNFSALLEYFGQLKKGNYQTQPVLDVMDKNIYWADIRDAADELGHCLAVQKDRIQKEENDTKSLITDISHQLKTPLASLKMCYELSVGSDLSPEEKQEFIEKENYEIKKLEALLSDLVNLSRLESRMIQIAPAKRNIRETVTDAVNQIYMKAFNKNIRMEADIPEGIIVPHDPKWTAEAFVNILDNAVKYSEPKTRITVRAKKLQSVVLIEFEDEGMGIEAGEQHKIFQRFYRGKAAGDVREGTGIGLYLTRKILEEQGGTIATKRRTPGTVFQVTLPLDRF